MPCIVWNNSAIDQRAFWKKKGQAATRFSYSRGRYSYTSNKQYRIEVARSLSYFAPNGNNSNSGRVTIWIIVIFLSVRVWLCASYVLNFDEANKPNKIFCNLKREAPWSRVQVSRRNCNVLFVNWQYIL